MHGPDKKTKSKPSKSILKYSKKILDKSGGFEYFTDGLIFLPMSLPVKGMIEGESVKSIKGTWKLNYKWKPPEENTIDFKIIFTQGPDRNKYIFTYTRKMVVKEKSVNIEKFNWRLVIKKVMIHRLILIGRSLTNKPTNKNTYQYFDPPQNKKTILHYKYSIDK